MIVPDKDKRIIRFIFSEANFCLGSNPFPEKKDEKIFFSSGMMMVRSIVRGACLEISGRKWIDGEYDDCLYFRSGLLYGGTWLV